MNKLQQMILDQGVSLGGSIVKVDNFLNHKIDVAAIQYISDEIYEYFKDSKPDIILTVEASGIVIAYALAEKMGCDMIFAKKGKAKNIGDDVYSANVHSFTKGIDYKVFVSKNHLKTGDRVIIVDDFLANAQAALGLYEICKQAGAEVIGVGIAVEKSWQRGAAKLRERNIDIYSVAKIEKIEGGKIFFMD